MSCSRRGRRVHRRDRGHTGSHLRIGRIATIVLICALPGIASGAEEERPAAVVFPEAPFAFDAPSATAACEWSGRAAEEPLPVRLTITTTGLEDPAALDPLLQCASERHLQPILRLLPPTDWMSAPDAYAALEPWIASLEKLLQRTRGAVRVFQLGDRPEEVFDARSYAFLVEKVATQIRATDAQAALVLGSLGDDAGFWLDNLSPARLAAYATGLSLIDPVDLDAWDARLRRDYPGRPVWLEVGATDLVAFLDRAQKARAGGSRMAILPADAPEGTRAMLMRLIQTLPARYVPLPGPPEVSLGEGSSGAVVAVWADPLGPEHAALIAPPASGPGPRVALHVSIAASSVSRVRAYDLASGREIGVQPVGPPGSGSSQFSVSLGQAPFLMTFIPQTEPRAAPETIGVVADYQPTAEEIIARARVREAEEGKGVHNYRAKATISYHYRAESLNESIDLVSVNRFFWKGGVGEYQETELFVNGARWRGQAPALPFVQAEKVKEVPVAIRLDESYRYTLDGKEQVDGSPCWALSFEPLHSDESLYSGRVWIDARTWDRRRVRRVQHGLKEPITSNTEEIEYGEVETGEGKHWLPLKFYGQMVFTVLGRSVVVERRVGYEEFSVNDEAFDAGREQAYASGRPILRDDPTGYTYVQKQGDEIVARPPESQKNIALFGGIGVKNKGTLSSPFAGLNYFDFDWRGSGTQIDLAFAGPFVDLVWTDPRLASTRWELSLEGRFIGLYDRFKKTTDIGRLPDEDVKVLEEVVFSRFSRPITPYTKLELDLDVAWDGFDKTKNTEPEFVLPSSVTTTTGAVRWRYHRSGYLLDLWSSYSRRSGWQDWGWSGEQGSASDSSFKRWGLSVQKAYHPTSLQKISLDLDLNAGSGMDRFSRFRVGDFRSIRIRGYNSLDITFDRGATGEVDYQFTLPRGGVSVTVGMEGGVLQNGEDFGLREAAAVTATARTRPFRQEGSRREYLLGGGIAVSWSGPWGTLMSVRAGSAFSSSIDVSGGTAVFRVVMIKTFDRWPWTHHEPLEPQPGTPEPR